MTNRQTETDRDRQRQAETDRQINNGKTEHHLLDLGVRCLLTSPCECPRNRYFIDPCRFPGPCLGGPSFPWPCVGSPCLPCHWTCPSPNSDPTWHCQSCSSWASTGQDWKIPQKNTKNRWKQWRFKRQTLGLDPERMV